MTCFVHRTWRSNKQVSEPRTQEVSQLIFILMECYSKTSIQEASLADWRMRDHVEENEASQGTATRANSPAQNSYINDHRQKAAEKPFSQPTEWKINYYFKSLSFGVVCYSQLTDTTLVSEKTSLYYIHILE